MLEHTNKKIRQLVEEALLMTDSTLYRTVLEGISDNPECSLGNISDAFPDIHPFQINYAIDYFRAGDVLSVDSDNDNRLSLTDDGKLILQLIHIFLAFRARETI